MRQILVSFIILAAALPGYSRSCNFNSQGEVDWQTECETMVSGNTLKRCSETKVPGSTPGTFKYEHRIRNFGWSTMGFHNVQCDLTLEQCQAFAEEQMNKSSFTDECGQVSTGRKVKYKFKTLDTQDLKFKTTHQGQLRK